MQPVDDYSEYLTEIERRLWKLKMGCLNSVVQETFDAHSDVVEQASLLITAAEKLMQLYAKKAKERA